MTDAFREALQFFVDTDPTFISVTCSAGGSGIDAVQAVTQYLMNNLRFTRVAAHMVCMGRSVEAIRTTIAAHHTTGVRHAVALRGDSTADDAAIETADKQEKLRYALDLVRLLRSEEISKQWQISVAGYPEIHPEAESAESDLLHLQHKVDAGANQILTQFFFDTDVFLRYRDKVAAQGITVPLVPGILPIMQFDTVVQFAHKCRAKVPDFLHNMLGGMASDKDGHDQLAFAFLSSQVETLYREGVEDFHFYTLNKTRSLELLVRWLKAYL